MGIRKNRFTQRVVKHGKSCLSSLWRYLKWHLGTWLSGALGCAGLSVGLDDLKGLSHLNDSMILCQLLRMMPSWQMHGRLLHMASSPGSAKWSQVHLYPGLHLFVAYQGLRLLSAALLSCRQY